MPEEQRTDEVRDGIFIDLFGKDGHGYSRTYGTGILPTIVHQQTAGPSQSTAPSQPPTQLPGLEEIAQHVLEHVKTRLMDDLTQLVGTIVSQAMASQGGGTPHSSRQVK